MVAQPVVTGENPLAARLKGARLRACERETIKIRSRRTRPARAGLRRLILFGLGFFEFAKQSFDADFVVEFHGTLQVFDGSFIIVFAVQGFS